MNKKCFTINLTCTLQILNGLEQKLVEKKICKVPQWLRNIKDRKYPFWSIDTFFSKNKYINKIYIKNGGWHFSNIKDAERY